MRKKRVKRRRIHTTNPKVLARWAKALDKLGKELKAYHQSSK